VNRDELQENWISVQWISWWRRLGCLIQNLERAWDGREIEAGEATVIPSNNDVKPWLRTKWEYLENPCVSRARILSKMKVISFCQTADVPESRRREKQTTTQKRSGAVKWMQCQAISNVVQLCFIHNWRWENHGTRPKHLMKFTRNGIVRSDQQ
jgi:hypothetical protein